MKSGRFYDGNEIEIKLKLHRWLYFQEKNLEIFQIYIPVNFPNSEQE